MTGSRDIHDSELVDRIRRTLSAVADATPLDEQRRADHHFELVVSPPEGEGEDGRWGRWRPSLYRELLAAAAVVLAVAAVAGTVLLAPSSLPVGPAGPDGIQPRERLEAGWLPGALDDREPERAATAGLSVDPDAAVFRQADGDSRVVVATMADSDAVAADAMTAALTRITQADQSTWGPGESSSATMYGDMSLVPLATTPDYLAQVAALSVEFEARPSEMSVPGWRTTPIPIDWVPGVAPSVTVRYGDAFTGPWVELATTVGELPDPTALDALLYPSEQIELDGTTAWLSSRSAGAWVAGPDGAGAVNQLVWQAADGLIGSVTTRGVAIDDLLRVAQEAAFVEDPSPVAPAPPQVIFEGELSGVLYQIEAWEDSWRGGIQHAAVATCWRVRMVGAGVEPTTQCVPPSPDMSPEFLRGFEVADPLVLGAVVSPDIATVVLDEGTGIDTAVVAADDRTPTRANLVLASGAEAALSEAVASLIDDDGRVVHPAMKLLHE